MTTEEAATVISALSGLKPLCPCGEGAYGVVWLVGDAIGRKIAVKIVDKSRLGNSWEREYKGMQNYCMRVGTDPHLIAILHVADVGSCFAYTMEAADNFSSDPEQYVPDTLQIRLERRGRFAVEEVVSIAQELLCGLKTLHSLGLVHRDIKPGNILFVHGKAKIGDIGLVASSESSVSIAGTPGFLPPELLHLETMNVRDCAQDLYSLGKVMYCMFSGYSPELYPSLPSELYRDPSLRHLNEFINHACSRERKKRFQTTEEFEKAFHIAVASSRFRRHRKRFFIAAFFLFGMTTALFATAGYFTVGKREKSAIAPTQADSVRAGGNPPSAFNPSRRLLFYDSLQNGASASWEFFCSPGELFSYEKDGLRIRSSSNPAKCERRDLFMDLPRISLSTDFEIYFVTEGDLAECAWSFFLYPHALCPNGLFQDDSEKCNAFVLTSKIKPEGVTFLSAVWNDEILKVGMEEGLNPTERISRWEHRILFERGKIIYYANGRKVAEVPFEAPQDRRSDGSLRFALSFATESPGSLLLSQVAAFSR